MLWLRSAQLQSDTQDKLAQLAHAEARKKQLLEEDMSSYDVALKTVPPMLVASKRMTIAKSEEVAETLGKAYRQIGDYITQQGGKMNGPCLTVWYTPASQHTNEVVEAAFPLAQPIPASADVQVHELPEVYVASVVHHGNFAEFQNGHAHILKWVEANHYQIGGEYREIYFGQDAQGMSTTEIQVKVNALPG